MTTHSDPAKLASLRELERPGNEGFFARILGVFLVDAQKRLADMTAGLAASDADAVAMAAHALKGGCAYVGADRLAELCSNLESVAKQELLDAGRTLLDEIRPEVAEVSAILSAQLSE